MNRMLKIIISVLGGINAIFSTFMPTMVVLLIINSIWLSELNQIILIAAGLLSTVYRGISYLIPVLTD
jgi:hypothetical protein